MDVKTLVVSSLCRFRANSILRWVIPVVFGFQCLTTARAQDEGANQRFQAPWNGEILGTGAKRPGPEQLEWAEQNLVKTKGVRFNPLGLQRINEHRFQNGHRPLPEDELVPLGSEPTASSGETGPITGAAVASLPTYIDNSTLPSFPPIRSQGSLGSCAQFSSVYYALTHMTALARNWNAKTGGDTLRFSPKWTYNMLNGGNDSGSWHYDAYSIALKHGLATWADFPYDADFRAWCLNSSAWRNALNFRASQAGKVADVDTDAGLGQVKQLLVNGYVLNFATYVYSWNWKAIGNDPSTTADDAFVGKQCAYSVNGASGGHSMTIVGFNDDIWVDINGDGLITPNEKGALRIANSWGTGWGESGFCWLAYDAIRIRNVAQPAEGIFWMDEATWVTARASYTPQLIAEFTLNHLKRNQLTMTLGMSPISATSPSSLWSPNRVLASAGGAYAFDGTTTARNGTFCLDLTDLAAGTVGSERYYLGMRDSTLTDVATLSGLSLIDLVHGVTVACPQVPRTADGSLVYTSVDYDLSAGGTPPPDTTPPTVQITSPANGSTVLGKININITSSDNVAVTLVQCYADGALIGSSSTASLSASWDTTTVLNGTHTIEAWAYDAAPNITKVPIIVTVNNPPPDTTPPVVQFTSPLNNSTLSGKTIKVAVSASDNVAVKQVQLSADGVLLGTDTATPYTFNWNIGKLAKGPHTLKATAVDTAGNLGTATITVTQ